MFLPFLLIFALLNSCIELEISAPSFPEIMRYFSVSENMVGMTITYNLIGFCIASVIYGPLSEYYGRRKVMILGNGILSIGALGCAIAPSIEFLLISRLIQGFGAATSAVIVSAIIADVYNHQKATSLYGIMNAIFTSVMSLAPILGGFITMHVGFRGNYSFVAIICISAWILLLKYLPETLKEEDRAKNLGIKEIGLNYKKLLSSKLFMASTIVPSLLYCGYLSFVAVAPFIYMNEFELTLLGYTSHQAIAVFAFALVSIFAGRVTKLFGAKAIIYLSLILCFLGSLLMILSYDECIFTFAVSIFYIGSAFLYPIIFASSLEIFPEIKGFASSAIMTIRYLLCSLVTGFTIYLYDGDFIALSLIMFGLGVMISILSIFLLKRVNF